MHESEFHQLVAEATAYLQAQNTRARAEFALDTCERYDLDLAGRRFWWLRGGVRAVEAQLTPVGTYAHSSQSWLWAWASPVFTEQELGDLPKVRAYGRQRGIRQLQEAHWPAEEVDGWEMTSVSASLLESASAYRCPAKGSSLFVLLDDLRLLEP